MKLTFDPPVVLRVKDGDGVIKDKSVSSIDLRETLTMSDLENWQADYVHGDPGKIPATELMRLAAVLSGEPLALFKAMAIGQWETVVDEILNFWLASRRIGRKPRAGSPGISISNPPS